MWLIAVPLLGLWLLYKYWTSIYNFWEKKGIPYIPGTFPFGSYKELSLMRNYQGYTYTKMYQKMSQHPYFGIFIMRSPTLVLRDPEMIRVVMAKEFSHFRNRLGIKLSETDYLSHHLFNLEGERWRALRTKLSPTFTSGKLKGMFPLFVSCAQVLDELLKSSLNTDVNAKDITARFTTDIICTSAFGLDTNTLQDPDNEFRKLGIKLNQKNILLAIKFSLLRLHRKMSIFFDFRLVEKDIEDFLIGTIRNTVEQREKNGIKRNDFLDLLIELKNKGTIGEELQNEENYVQPFDMTIEMMAAQCFVFFVAGFETSSSVQSFCLYELALNPEVQERLQGEIDRTIEKHGDITYQGIQEMEYLDMVVSETMRKYPTLTFLTRTCTKTFQMPLGHTIDKGDRVLIPLWALHRDPQWFPNPEKFDPERFSQENKGNIKPFSYLPFGEGPRICIGMRFGLLQTKMGLITVLRKYTVGPTEKTQIPIRLRATNLITRTEGPIHLRITSRTPA